jgi:peptide/nickel transport system ATP-binding protein
VGRQVGEVLSIHRGLSRHAARQQAAALLARVGFEDPAGHARAVPHQLSGGQRQRVMLAMALACAPALVLADEPTTALDVTVQAQVLALLDELVDEQGSALLLISHDLAVVSQRCERLLVMYGGTIVESGPTAELLAAPFHPYTAGLLATAAAVSPDRRRDGRPLTAIAGRVPELGRFPSGCVFRNRCPRATARCATAPALAERNGAGHAVACWHPIERLAAATP